VPVPSPYAAIVARTPVEHSTRTLRGTVTHVWTYGTGARRVVFLHGYRGDHHGIEPVVAHLVAADPALSVVVPDLPGFGATAPLPHDRHDVDGYVAWAGELLDGEPDAVLAGHSFGSVVAAAVAAGRKVPALVLVNPIAAAALSGPRVVMTRLTALFHAAAGALPAPVGSALLRSRVVTRIASVAMATTHDPELRRWIHAEHDLRFSSFASRDSLLEAFTASVTRDVSQYADAVEAPTLLVAAQLDDLAPPATQTALLRRFADAQLVMLPDTGHLAHYEAPAAVAARIAEWLLL
jgi:pimeloyl-ACP methyl ester carboxylesterase